MAQKNRLIVKSIVKYSKICQFSLRQQPCMFSSLTFTVNAIQQAFRNLVSDFLRHTAVIVHTNSKPMC